MKIYFHDGGNFKSVAKDLKRGSLVEAGTRYRIAPKTFWSLVLVASCLKASADSGKFLGEKARVESHGAKLVQVKDLEGGGIRFLVNLPRVEEHPSGSTQSEIGLALIDLVDRSNHSLDLAVYGIRKQPDILSALARAKARGVEIRIVADQDVSGESYYSDTKRLKEFGDFRSDVEVDRVTALLKGQIPQFKSFWPSPPGFKGPPQCVGYTIDGNRAIIAVHASREPLQFNGDIMHHKFAIADGRAVWSGSANLSDSCTGGYNANAAFVIESKVVAAWFGEEFQRLFSGSFHRRKTDSCPPTVRKVEFTNGCTANIGFCPQDYCFENIVEPALISAQESIDVAMFFLTHRRAAGELIKAHRRGVQVRVIIDATAAGNGYSKHELLRVAGIPVKVENWGGKMHMKCALIDGRKLIAGSMNWTTEGERSNDENLVLIDDARVALKFSSAFEDMWNSIPQRWLNGRPDPESIDSPGSESDEIDNDFDGLVDGADPGCGPNPPPLEQLPPYRIVPLSDGWQLIKGNISKAGKVYHVPGSELYEKTKISTDRGERWFPSVIEAREAGWRSSKVK